MRRDSERKGRRDGSQKGGARLERRNESVRSRGESVTEGNS